MCSCTTWSQVKAHSLIIATGATAKKLGIPKEQTFWSKGISACAICDGSFVPPMMMTRLEPGHRSRVDVALQVRAPSSRTSPLPWWAEVTQVSVPLSLLSHQSSLFCNRGPT